MLWRKQDVHAWKAAALTRQGTKWLMFTQDPPTPSQPTLLAFPAVLSLAQGHTASGLTFLKLKGLATLGMNDAFLIFAQPGACHDLSSQWLDVKLNS